MKIVGFIYIAVQINSTLNKNKKVSNFIIIKIFPFSPFDGSIYIFFFFEINNVVFARVLVTVATY